MKERDNFFGPFLSLILFLILFLSFNVRIQEPVVPIRISIKTLTDSGAKQINFNPKHSSISEFIELPKPFKVSNDLPRSTYEYSAYQINCIIRSYKQAENGDYNLVLQDLDDTSKTIIGEIINPTQILKDKIQINPEYLLKFSSTYTEFEKVILPNNKVKRGIYKLVGICFFDKAGTEPGTSKKNGVKLAPIIYLLKFK